MSLRKFGKNDVILNTMRTYPKSEFLIYDGKVYYNNVPNQSGSKNVYVRNVPPGYISLYEYNIDRQYVDTGRVLQTSDLGFLADGVNAASASVPDTGRIYPWTTKGSDYYNLMTVSTDDYEGDDWGDVLQGTYPLSASITRELMGIVGGTDRAGSTYTIDYPLTPPGGLPDEGAETTAVTTPRYRHYYALKNTLEHNGIRSVHYNVLYPPPTASGPTLQWNKSEQTINMISIPKIFYGSRIRPGSLSLKWYYTGSLTGELRDEKQNGELRQVVSSSEYGAAYDGEVAGVVLYDEGFILLTGSWALNPAVEVLSGASGDTTEPSWIYYGLGAHDGPSADPPHGGSNSRVESDVPNKVSFKLSFQGETETQVMTMFTRAGRGKANFSNNPTYLTYGQSNLQATSSRFYEENASRTIYNSVSSSYSDFEAPFKRQLYVSRVAIYDDKKNLIGIATLGSPVLKKEDQDITFKLRLDL
tara:strand:+ start:2104 stop:3522 length:1419 start_codon:yes stop_codon:yes gene_type:complete